MNQLATQAVEETLYFETEYDEYLYNLWLEPEPLLNSAGYELTYDGDNDGVDGAYEYYNDYGITKSILKEYGVHAIKSYQYVTKEGDIKNNTLWQYPPPVIAYKERYFAKLYIPNVTKASYLQKFLHVRKKERDYIFGMSQIINRAYKSLTGKLPSQLIITGGEKDVLTLRALGYDAIAFNSETAGAPQYFIDTYKDSFQNISILYDNDEAGIKGAEKVLEILTKNSFSNVAIRQLPLVLKEKNGKDVSDYVKLKLKIDELHEAINGLYTTATKVVALEALSQGAEVKLISNFESITEKVPTTPFLPDEVFELAPHFLKNLSNVFKDKRDRDVNFLSLLTVLSTCFPNIFGIYGGKVVGANFYLFISAPASAGKGTMSWSRIPAEKISKHINDRYKKAIGKYLHELEEYKSKRKENPELEMPEKPKEPRFFIPANSSTSMVYSYLDANQSFGLIHDSEGDTLSDNMKNDWGDFSSLLRKAFHHEHSSMARRKDNEYLEIDKPHLSVVLSGTRNQVGKLINSVENGLFSRFVFYDFDAEVEWRDQFGNGDDSILRKFLQSGETFLKYWEHAEKAKPTTFLLNENYQTEVTNYFSNKIKEMHQAYGDDVIGSVRRIGLVFYRIAIIISALNHYRRANYMKPELPEKIIIDEREARCAFLIVDTLLKHFEIVYNRMQKGDKLNQLNTKQQSLYEALPEEFTWQEFKSIANSVGILASTTEKYRRDLMKHKLIDTRERGKYMKI